MNASRYISTNSMLIHVGIEVEAIDDSALLPGDRILVTESMTVPCDAILVSGKVVIDESMLTGESVPVGKVPMDMAGLVGDDDYVLLEGTISEDFQRVQQQAEQEGTNKDTSIKDFEYAAKRSGSVLFSGTKVKACFGDECIAVVYRTGYRSVKGSLVLSLLKPKNGFITFVSDAMWVLLAMVIFCTVLYFSVSAVLFEQDGATATEISFWYFDALTCAVPSALIASLSIATTVSIARLRLLGIFVSDTSRINYAGVVSAACFDKTGTLTDEKLSFKGVLCSETSINSCQAHFVDCNVEENTCIPAICQEIMATCHGLLLYGLDSSNSSAVGDPLEMELLQASGWILQPSSTVRGQMLAYANAQDLSARRAYTIVKHFEFTPDRLRAASIVQEPSGRLVYLLKGSPEAVIRLCNPVTLPDNIQEELLVLARKGLRVIALAYRTFPENLSLTDLLQYTQSACEDGQQLTFVGLLYLSNKLKDDATRTITALHRARIHVNMITGDHVFTAIAIAGACGILTAVSSNGELIPSAQHHSHSQLQHPSSTSNFAMSTSTIVSASTDASHQYSDQVFVIDTKEDLQQLVLLDAATESQVLDMHLYQAIYLAALTYLQDFHVSADHSASDNRTVRRGPRVQLAVTGKGLLAVQRLYPEALPSLVRYAKVFARTKPSEKKLVVETLMACPEFDNLINITEFSPESGSATNSHGSYSNSAVEETTGLLSNSVRGSGRSNNPATTSYSSSSRSSSGNSRAQSASPRRTMEEEELLHSSIDVAFCGDGANDMIALRAATVGISLCDAETSVAAPITSRKATPFAVIEVLREGRSSLITAYVLILFNAMYATIQVFYTNCNYFFGLQGSGWSFLVQDLFYALVLGIATSYSAPSATVSSTMPPKRFLRFYLLFRLLSNLLLFMGFQILALYLLTEQSFYSTEEIDDPFNESYGYPTAVGQQMALGQIMIASVVSSIGEPFRQAWYYNHYLIAALVVQFGWLLFQLFAQDDWFLVHVLKIESLPTYFAGVLLGLLALNLLCSLAVTELCDFLLLQSTNRRWFEIATLPELHQPVNESFQKKMNR